MSTLLQTIYASTPSDYILLPTLEIKSEAFDTLYLVNGYEDISAKLETGQTVTFVATAMDVSIPNRDNSGNQKLIFAIENVTHIAQEIIDKIIDQEKQAFVVFRQYISTILTEPAETPITLSILGGVFSGSTVQIECSYYDILNTTFPRRRYTTDFAPGIRYF